MGNLKKLDKLEEGVCDNAYIKNLQDLVYATIKSRRIFLDLIGKLSVLVELVKPPYELLDKESRVNSLNLLRKELKEKLPLNYLQIIYEDLDFNGKLQCLKDITLSKLLDENYFPGE